MTDKSNGSSKQFTIGEQPDWAGTEECIDAPDNFIASLLKDPASSLIKSGYALIELPEQITDTYTEFHDAFVAFSRAPEEDKERYASKQFEQGNKTKKFSPNQFHGFSVMSGLKEQFMMRLCGENMALPTPGQYKQKDGKTKDLGIVGMKLYEQLDLTCRGLAHEVVSKLSLPKENVDKVLDPINVKGGEPTRDPEDANKCYSKFVPPNYISSSIMDNFHYFNSFSEEEDAHERFHNNHAAHTDSGLLTTVVVTDKPGLEVFDQDLDGWIAIEKYVHAYAKAKGVSHRRYCSLFWGDSVVYLKDKTMKPCLHRVGKCEDERFSIVFKQRTSPLATAPRYQEDYELALVQMKAMDIAKKAAQ